MERIHELINNATICIADLKETNPNVMYEAGIAFTLKKPVVFITQGDLKSITFDIRHHRIVSYDLGPAGLDHLYNTLSQALKLTD